MSTRPGAEVTRMVVQEKRGASRSQEGLDGLARWHKLAITVPQKDEAKGLKVQVLYGLQSMFKASIGYIVRPVSN